MTAKQLITILLLVVLALSCNTPMTTESMTTETLQDILLEKGLTSGHRHLFLRAFKQEKILELWVGKDDTPFQLIRTYPFCVSSGTLGPKRREGDLQIPEGIYHVNRFNPNSKFHLSLGLNYPNAADLKHADPLQPGSDIFIHGGCASVGCIAITDSKIEELFPLCIESRDEGKNIEVHIFPFRMTKEQLSKFSSDINYQSLTPFWNQLEPIYQYFEQSNRLPAIVIDERGNYIMTME